MTVNNSNTQSTQPTDDQIDAAILAALTEAQASSGEELHSWAAIRQRLPGSLDRANERLIALWHAGRVWTCKVRGRNYVALGDADDVRLAEAHRARAPLAL
ncbi:hypothetical protein Mkiyose1088_13870 [Mycobacterium kiyosense]|uniref:hypothetical protein n=1 Tax=Mycobacterium TaxID=1763 RepID=UPI001EEFDE6E|nr:MULTISPECIES: hypothetical protein [Mycobacterium]BDB41979.1 hypothetical protein IWGMT90018_24250 [Mycobacterium kiyosense]BDE14738.1 hypothetical protein MKCMC460_35980 [Mycobacterium sp. 20KCMC460]GLC03584.1 hypothetical protein SRL2020400_41750 [Mycobacterium kiyosense]GLC99520.1 hypothetical protein Mkiyose1088_13870 [Mycobacterium kiyosense]GLD07262.1 hypothetical protein Mkiyose1383_35880 [Mycobacterium kiyosense]